MNNYTKQTEELLTLIKENPDLPIVPIVDGEICNDDYGWYLGSWGFCCVKEFLTREKYDTFEIMWKDDDVWDTLEKYFTIEEFNAIPDSKGREVYESLPWIKAIIIRIGVYKNE